MLIGPVSRRPVSSSGVGPGAHPLTEADLADKTPSLAAQVQALSTLSMPQLRERYAALFGEPTNSRNRVWLFRSCAWQVQAQAEGGLSERAKRRAAEIVRESDVRPRRALPTTPSGEAPGTVRVVTMKPAKAPEAPLPGTVLVRQYRGQEIRVLVLEKGFLYDARTFRSLSAVAKAVTGAHWSGRLFFGLRGPSKPQGSR